jgi:hypothetical protein
VSARITILPDDHALPALRWSVVSTMPRRRATVFAREKREAQLLGAQLLGVAPDRCIAVNSPVRLPSLELA